MNPLHSSAYALNNQMSLSASNSPKSPSLHVLPTTAASSGPITATTASASNLASNLMSTSLNSTQVQNHLSTATGNASGATSLSVHSAATAYVPSAMSTSLHGGGTTTTAAGSIPFDSNGTAWNSTSSLSPTIPAQLRKCEVKLNAMP